MSGTSAENWPALASAHADERYYLLVERRLMLADQAVQQSGRNALREMRGEMVRGTFPVARG